MNSRYGQSYAPTIGWLLTEGQIFSYYFYFPRKKRERVSTLSTNVEKGLQK